MQLESLARGFRSGCITLRDASGELSIQVGDEVLASCFEIFGLSELMEWTKRCARKTTVS
eukprot:3434793-Amphidinium_carterae.1